MSRSEHESGPSRSPIRGARTGYRPPQAYAAHPMNSYGTDHAGACLDFLHERTGGWEIVDPATVFADTADWLARWPSLHRELSVVIVFGDEQGYVGAGCLREVTDLPRLRTLARTARLVLGGCPYACCNDLGGETALW